MAIAFINAAGATSPTGTALAGSEPAGVGASSCLLAFTLTYDDNAITATPNDGTWTALPAATAVASTTNLATGRVWYRIGPASSYLWTLSASTYADIAIAAWSGVDTTTPIDATATGNGGNGTTRTGLSVTTATADAWLVLLTGGYGAAINSAPSGMTQRILWDTVNYIYDLPVVSAGATGDKTAGQPGADSWTASMVALRAAGAAPTGRKAIMTTRRGWW